MDYQILFFTFIMFGVIFISVLGLYHILLHKSVERKEMMRRLEQMSENNPEYVKVDTITLFQNKRKNVVERKINEYLIRIKKENEFKMFIERMGLNVNSTQLFVIFTILVCACYAALTIFYDEGFIEDILFAFIITITIFIFTINFIISSRQQKILKELPFAIEVLIRSVKSGFSLDRAFKIVSHEIKDPLSSELQNIVRKIELGVSFEQTFRNSSNRVKLRDYTFFCNALIIQHETGGRLEDILNNIMFILKRSMDLQSKIKIITSEVKTTGIILGATPVAIWFIIQIIKPEFISFFLHEPDGIHLFKIALGLFVTECTIIYYMLRIKVE